MKTFIVPLRIQIKRFKRRLNSKLKRKNKKRKALILSFELKRQLGADYSYENQLNTWLTPTLKFVLYENSTLKDTYKKTKYIQDTNTLKVFIPEIFCLKTNPKDSIEFVYTLLFAIISDSYKNIYINYSKCITIDLTAQIFLDSLLKDLVIFVRKRRKFPQTKPFLNTFKAEALENSDLKKILFSVGSFAVVNKNIINFADIIPYHLCVHNKEEKATNNTKRKEVDATLLVDHLVDCLKVLGKDLSAEAITDMSTIVGEVLSNAEEHSTLNNRYSTGYFQKIEKSEKDSVYGVYHLVILNYGESIYEKFKSPECTNFEIIARMKELSDQYTKKSFFSSEFSEESLWTLYALQEGVTSVSVEKFKRGHGSINFIESFFSLAGNEFRPDESSMAIISGHTNILFDGKYQIGNKLIGNESFKVMTFNKSGNIEDKPDRQYVKKSEYKFPGTIISAKILITKDDIK